MQDISNVISDKKIMQAMPAVQPTAYASFSKANRQFAAVTTSSINDAGPLSFGGWFRLRESSNEGPLTICGWSQSGGWGSTHMLRGSYRFGSGSSTTNFSIPALPLNEWVHLAASYDGDGATMYVNGQVVHEILMPITRKNNADQFRVSSFDEGSLKYSSVDARHLFAVRRGLAKEDVAQLMGASRLSPGIGCLARDTLIGAWNIDEGEGTLFKGIGGSVGDMTALNGCGWGRQEA